MTILEAYSFLCRPITIHPVCLSVHKSTVILLNRTFRFPCNKRKNSTLFSIFQTFAIKVFHKKSSNINHKDSCLMLLRSGIFAPCSAWKRHEFTIVGWSSRIFEYFPYYCKVYHTITLMSDCQLLPFYIDFMVQQCTIQCDATLKIHKFSSKRTFDFLVSCCSSN